MQVAAYVPTRLLELLDVDVSGVVDGQALIWNGLEWVPGDALAGPINFSDIEGQIGIDQFPSGSVATLESIDEDAVYFFDNTALVPRLIGSSEAAAFVAQNLNFSALQGEIGLEQFPSGTVVTLDSIDEDAFYFFDNVAFVPKLLGKADALAFLLPDQTGHSGEFLKTVAGALGWAAAGSSGAWGSITGTLSDQTDLQSALDAKQPLDSDLTTIAGLTATTDNFIVSVSSAWASRTPAQVRTTLGLVVGTNVQAWDADLDALAALSGTHTIYYRSAANTWSSVTIGSGLDFTGATLSATGGGTVTNTGGNLTSNSVVLGAGTVDTKVVAGFTTDGTSKLTLGSSTNTGKLELNNTSGGNGATIYPTNDSTASIYVNKADNATHVLVIDTTNKFLGIGTSPSYALDVSGTGRFSSNVYVGGISAGRFVETDTGGLLIGRTASETRTDLGLVIGTNVQAWDADLDALAALSGTNTIYYRSAANTWTAVTIGGNLTFSAGTLNATGAGSGTVTNTGGALTANSVVLGAGTADTKVVAGIITDGISKFTLGVAGTSRGGIDFKNATSGTVTVQPPTGALGTITLTLPISITGTLATQEWVNGNVASQGVPVLVTGTGFWHSTAGTLNGSSTTGTGTGSVVQADSPDLTTKATLTRTGLGTTTNDGFLLTNTTAAANNAQQVSPNIRWLGKGWDSTASTSKSVDAHAYLKPVQNAGDPTGQLIFEFSLNANAYANPITLDSSGNLTLSGLSASALVATDSNKKLVNVTIGSGLSYSAGTLSTTGGGGSVATDTIFDAKGDLAVGTGADTAAKLTVGANDTMLMADSAQTTGLKWGNAATVKTALGLVIGTNVQAWDADLDTWAGITPGSGVGTFLATPSSANLRSALTDELGSGAALFDGATLVQSLTFATNSTSLAPFNVPAGTLKTTPADGDFEADADCFYGCTDAGNRGYISIRHVIRADATVTQANDANAHAIFTTPANGRLTLETGTYRFHGALGYSSMSATSGNVKIDIVGAGTATTGAWLWVAVGGDIGAGSGSGAGMSWNNSAASGTNVIQAGTGTALGITIDGTFEVTVAGTIIPTQTLVTAAAAVLSIGSFIEFWRIGSTSMTSVGQWD